MAEALSRSTDYRVLRRLVPRTTFTPSVDAAVGQIVELHHSQFDDFVFTLSRSRLHGNRSGAPDGACEGRRQAVPAGCARAPAPTEEDHLVWGEFGFSRAWVDGRRHEQALVNEFGEAQPRHFDAVDAGGVVAIGLLRQHGEGLRENRDRTARIRIR
jgi:hypothetical protein